MLEKEPNFCPALHCMAQALMHPDVADFIGCYRMLKRCMDVDPCHVDALCTYAVFLSDYLCDREEALRTYDNVLNMDPSNLIALTGKASLLAENCDQNFAHQGLEVDRVKRIYEEILHLYPESVEALIGSACFKKRVLSERESAKILFKRALGLDPSNIQALFNLASIAHFDEGDLQGALEVASFGFAMFYNTISFRVHDDRLFVHPERR